MKDSINLVSTFVESKPQRVINLGKLKYYLKIGNYAVLIFITLGLLLLGLISWQIKAQSAAKLATEKKLAALSGDEKLIDSLLTRQKQLEYIEKQRPNIKAAANLIQGLIPEDVVLTSLKISRDRVTISAKTPGILSFTVFINNLIVSKYFKKISLVQSAYNQDPGTYSFTLECLII
jgi:Tfp pilus assembly protein PilN